MIDPPGIIDNSVIMIAIQFALLLERPSGGHEEYLIECHGDVT